LDYGHVSKDTMADKHSSQRPDIQSGGQPAQNWQGQPQNRPGGGQMPVQAGGVQGYSGQQAPGGPNNEYYGAKQGV
jgi:hypothetical protein